jgi:hypothetical protein
LADGVTQIQVLGRAGADRVSYALRSGPVGVRVRIGAGPVSGNGADGPPGGRDRILARIEGATGSPQMGR